MTTAAAYFIYYRIGYVKLNMSGQYWFGKEYSYKTLKVFHKHPILIKDSDLNYTPGNKATTHILSHSKKDSIFKLSEIDIDGLNKTQHVTGKFEIDYGHFESFKLHPNSTEYISNNFDQIQLLETTINLLTS